MRKWLAWSALLGLAPACDDPTAPGADAPADEDRTPDDVDGTDERDDDPGDPGPTGGRDDATTPAPYWPADVALRVCADGSADFVDLQAAIDASTPLGGQKIGVCPGTYGPISLGWQQDVVIQSIEGRDVTTIDGGGEPAVIVKDATLVLDGFRLTGTGIRDQWFPEGGAVSVHESDVTLRNIRVDGATGSFALLFDEDYLVLEDTLWEDNTGSDMLWYMYQGTELIVRDTTVVGGTYEHVFKTDRINDVVLENNVFADITIDAAKTAFDFESMDPGVRTVTNNLFYNVDDLDVWGGRLLDGPAVFANNLILDCDTRNLRPIDASYSLFWDNGVDYAPFVTGPGNVFADPLLADPANGDYTPLPGSPAIDAGDPSPEHADADGSRNDIGHLGGA